MHVDIREAKKEFSKLLERVTLGEEIIICKAGVPIARLVPASAAGKRPLGLFKGQMWIADDFDAPLPHDILAGFLGEDEPAGKAVKARKKRINRQIVSKKTP